jgi:hypothetical protein
MAIDKNLDHWLSSWPDAVAFAVGLAVAWWAGWNTGDLVWSLWLSSLVVGYATIVWMITQPVAALVRASWNDRGLIDSNPKTLATFWAVILFIALFFLAFFTVHFGGFHYGHSQFLIWFFPIDTGHGRADVATMSTYVEVLRRYWPFLPSAFLAHRAAFLRKPLSIGRDASFSSLGDSKKLGDLFSEPYRNVIRMHMLIFFFFAAHFAKLEKFAVYGVVYAVYFFPWRLVRKPTTELVAASDPVARQFEPGRTNRTPSFGLRP